MSATRESTALVSRLQDLVSRSRRVAVGQFDGVHLGHRNVIAGADTVLTFDPHPLAVLRPEAVPRLLTSVARKAELLGQFGVRELVVAQFDDGLALQSAGEFIERVLVGRLSAVDVSVGANFRFGHRAAGDVHTLRGDGRFDVRVAEVVRAGPDHVSSTRIRRLVAAGDVGEAGRLLGDPLRVEGRVLRRPSGRRSSGGGYLTLELDHAFACPAPGIYLGRIAGRETTIEVRKGRAGSGQAQGYTLHVRQLSDPPDDRAGTVAVDFLERIRDHAGDDLRTSA